MTSKVIAELEVIADDKGTLRITQKETEKLRRSTEKLDNSTKKLRKSRDRHMRTEKGAAGISSNSTKNFSKMQQNIDGGGGGGLVRAYALLAANVFALTAAFGVLQRSAQIDQLTKSMEILSTVGGQNIEILSRKMVVASGGAIDLAQSFRQVSLASSAGLSTKEIEGLTTVAKGAALSLGRDLPDALDRIFRGAIKLEPEILDEIGLFVRVDEAAARYASTIGKSASSLTQAEKRQAFLNEILEQGTKKFQVYADAIEPDAFTRLAASLKDIAQTVTSFVNSALGPFVGFLAESKSILTAVFIAVAAILLKQAVPALGKFITGQELAAQAALKESQDYKKAQERKINALKAFQLAQNKAASEAAATEAKRLGEENRTMKRFKTTAKGAVDEKTLSKQLNNEKRLAVIKTRQADLEKSRQQVRKAASKNLIDVELKALQKERDELERIVKLEKERAVLKTRKGGADLGTVGAAKEQAVLNKAMTATAAANVTAVAENKGLIAGLKEMKTLYKTGAVEIDGQTKTLKGFTKASALAKSGVGLLGVGLQGLMASLGPIMLAFSVLSPLLIAFGKYLGLGSKEAKRAANVNEELKKSTENLTERFLHQTRAMENQQLTFIETRRAALAYSKTQVEVAQKIIEAEEAFLDFQATASKTAKVLESIETSGRASDGFVTNTLVDSIPGLKEALQLYGLVAQSLEEQKDANQQLAAQKILQGAVLEGDAQYLAQLQEIIPSLKAKSDEFKRANVLNKQLAETETEIGKITKENFVANAIYTRGKRLGLTLDEAIVAVYGEESDALSTLNKREQEVLRTRLEQDKELKSFLRTFKDMRFSTSEVIDLAGVTIKRNEEQKKSYEALTSAVDGAKDSMRAFKDRFIPKTDVDEILGSLNQIQGTFKNLSEKDLENYFKNFKDLDNPIKDLFNEQDLKDIASGQGEDVFQRVINQVEEIQNQIVLAKTELKALNQEAKELQKFTKESVTAAEDYEKVITRTAERQLESAKGTLDLAAKANGTTGEDLLTRAESYRIMLDQGTLQEALLNNEIMIGDKVLARKDVLSIINAAQEYNNTLTEQNITILTEQERIDLGRVKILQTIVNKQKEYYEAVNKGIKLEQQLLAAKFKADTTLNPDQTANLAIKSAKLQYELAIQENTIKRALIDAEYALLIAQIKANDKITGERESTLISQLETAQKLTGSILEQEASNAKKTYSVALADAFRDGSKNGLLSGIRAGAGSLEQFRLGVGTTESFQENAISAPGMDQIQVEQSVQKIGLLKAAFSSLKDTMKDFGPEGVFVSAVSEAFLQIGNAVGDFALNMEAIKTAQEEAAAAGETFNAGLAKGAAVAEFAGSAISQIGAIMSANSQRQVSEIDAQIKAEQNRDGKSKESLARIQALEKKKEAIERKNFERNKKVQMAVTIANTASAIMAALAAPPLGYGMTPMGFAAAGIAAATGAIQLAVISKMKYNGGSSDAPAKPNTSLEIGGRSSAVDVAKGATSQELAYLRGGRTTGENLGGAGASFPGGAMGRRGYAGGGEGIIVGENGPEVVAPRGTFDIIPNYALPGQATNVNFTINAVDGQSVQRMLQEQQGNIIGMIRSAANENGETFLETVDTQVYGGGG